MKIHDEIHSHDATAPYGIIGLLNQSPSRRANGRGHDPRRIISMSTAQDIPVGRCQCGCGHPTRPAPKTSSRRGWVKGEPLKYVAGHRPPKRPALERFMEKVEKTDTCWRWLGPGTPYGLFWLGEGQVSAHRFAYEHYVGPIPEGLHLDHLCRNTRCVNPDHLEAVTPRENMMRGYGPAAQNARKTHCKNGHPLSGPNLYMHPSGSRQCRTCRRAERAAR